MRDDELDRILSRSLSEEEIVPSAGFSASVMDAVRHEAAAPSPIPFPWKRALPGFIAAGITFVWIIIEMVVQLSRAATAPELLIRWGSVAPVWQAATNAGFHWLALALLLSLASVMLSMRLTSAIFQR